MALVSPTIAAIRLGPDAPSVRLLRRPAAEIFIDRKSVSLRPVPRCAGFMADIAAALAFGPISVTLDRTASDQARG